jgi:hypothetical protein
MQARPDPSKQEAKGRRKRTQNLTPSEPAGRQGSGKPNGRGRMRGPPYCRCCPPLGTRECASTIETVSPLLGDREGQRFAVAATVATEVSGKVGRSVHDNLGGAGR